MANRVHCKECGNWKNDRGRGLCWSCKRRLQAAGTLDDLYPAYYPNGVPVNNKPRRQKPIPNVLEGGSWQLVPNSAGLWVWIEDKPEDQG